MVCKIDRMLRAKFLDCQQGEGPASIAGRPFIRLLRYFLLIGGSRRLVMMMVRCCCSCRTASIRILRRLDGCIHGSCAGYIVVEVGARRDQVHVEQVRPCGTGADVDAGRIDPLLIDQIRLGIDCAFCSLCIAVALVRSTAADQNCLGVALRWRFKATSSRQALASLSTRTGRRLSRPKLIEHRCLGLRCRRRGVAH